MITEQNAALFETRRQFLGRASAGIGSAALASLLNPGLFASGPAERVGGLPGFPNFAPKAKRVIYLFQNGAPSQFELFDNKPEVSRRHGEPLDSSFFQGQRLTGMTSRQKDKRICKSVFKFKRHGQSGIPVSEIFPHTAKCIDDIAVIRSMHADIPNHEPSLMLMNCGEARLIRPSVGSWVTYGLGSENQNLPGFISMCPGYPIQESQNWQSGFLPGIYQGTHINTRHTSVDKLIEHVKNRSLSLGEQRRQLDFIQQLNREHAAKRQKDAQLEARIQSIE